MRSPTSSRRATTFGVVLIVLVGLLNFHVPHFLFQAPAASGVPLELLLLAYVVGALVGAVAIYGDREWGWVLGIVVTCVSVLVYVVQETVGLPGLPKNWWEPSRLLSLLVEVAFLVLAGRQLGFLRTIAQPPR